MHVLYPHQVLCVGCRCRVELGGRSLYRDSDYLSDWGAYQLVELLAAPLGSTGVQVRASNFAR